MPKPKAKATRPKRRTMLVWRMRNGRPEFRGLYSPERARRIAGRGPAGWQPTPLATVRR